MPAIASAQSGFNGTWKVNFDKSKMSKKPDVFLVQDGMFQCKTCVPAVDVKADGQDQKLTGNPYADTLSIKIVNANTVIEEVSKKNGKVVGTNKDVVSAYGNTLTFEYSDSSATNAAP